MNARVKLKLSASVLSTDRPSIFLAKLIYGLAYSISSVYTKRFEDYYFGSITKYTIILVTVLRAGI